MNHLSSLVREYLNWIDLARSAGGSLMHAWQLHERHG